MLPQPPPQALLDAMAALGWRAPLTDAHAQAEITALDRAAAALPPGAKHTTIEDIRRRLAARRNRLAEAPAEPIEMLTAEDEYMRQAARADETLESLALPPDVLERMREDQERAEREKGGPPA